MSRDTSRRPGRVTTRDRLARALLAAFLLATAVDLGGLLADVWTVHAVAKPLLMPLLAGHVAARGGPRLLVAALLFGWGGDVALLFDADPAFMLGMGSFAVGHVCYLFLFKGAPMRRPLGAAYALALVGTVTLLWPDLPADLRVPVAGYSLLLTVMAFRASGLGLYAGLGGALFLLSDTLIATGVAQWPQLPAPDFWVMATYAAAQCLLALGVLGAPARAVAPAQEDLAAPAYGERRTAL
ncbi:lysoplasmalogenase [Streptomyces sp. NBC_00237]|uniref:lysoplasmalogenase n=1 Tax=Streptomyces sp. NBC_00237 TaxID=2975687 RepID=UPI00225843A1|nr:lysoplasmalogenase [Streptomyces sp. NBC_00237]MCX5202063.1 lysoplasmalogenase [Streptomyces sp. NBC_00237]